MDPWTWNETLWALGFLGITYMPLQCVALWKCRGGARVAAALPLFVMSAMLVFDFQPLDYDIGSRTAMYFVCPYLPAMIFSHRPVVRQCSPPEPLPALRSPDTRQVFSDDKLQSTLPEVRLRFVGESRRPMFEGKMKQLESPRHRGHRVLRRLFLCDLRALVFQT